MQSFFLELQYPGIKRPLVLVHRLSVQSASQPSRLTRLPSSHSSGGSTMLLPHTDTGVGVNDCVGVGDNVGVSVMVVDGVAVGVTVGELLAVSVGVGVGMFTP